MDDERIKKRQSLKIIISEAIMVLAVVVMVVALAFIVSGYWVNSDFKVQRQGMIQISSIPTGAELDIDGESSWFQRTNTSKVLASGEHMVTLSKDGYDTWSKTINVSEGLLYRIHYPRLFLQDRTTEKALSVTGAQKATISPDNKTMVLIGDTTEWQKINLNNEKLEPEKLNLSKFLPGTSLADNAVVGLFNGEVVDADWDRSGNHILLKVVADNVTEWILVDVDNAKNTINLTREFGADFSAIKIMDDSSSNLLAVQNGNLHKINISSRSISAVLVKDVIDFDHYEDEVVFCAAKNINDYTIGLVKIDDGKTTKLTTSAQPVKVALSKFYDDMYISILEETSLSIYKKIDFVPISDYNLSFNPKTIEVGHNGEFITMANEKNVATLDMEASAVREWSIEGDDMGWIDNDMIYTVAEGDLIVYDFDGYNRRILAKNVSGHFPVTITDDKWLYYFSDGYIIRENLTR